MPTVHDASSQRLPPGPTLYKCYTNGVCLLGVLSNLTKKPTQQTPCIETMLF